MKLLALFLLSALAIAPQEPGEKDIPGRQRPMPMRVFRVVQRSGELMYLEANRSGVSAWNALRELEELGAFDLSLDVPSLAEKLQQTSVNLAFDEMEARSVAQLVCVVAGLDLVEDRQKPAEGESGLGKLLVTVVSPPEPESESGRTRLRNLALDWYDKFAFAEVAESLGGRKLQSRVRIERALLFQEQGDFGAAADEFEAFIQGSPKDPYLPVAQFRRALCFFEIGQYEKTRQLTRRLIALQGEQDVGLRSAILLGRTHLAIARRGLRELELRPMQERESYRIQAELELQHCINDLSLVISSFRGHKELPELLLVMAEAQWMRGHYDGVFEELRQLEHATEPTLLSPRLWALHYFFLGIAEAEVGDTERGERALWSFLRRFPQHRLVPSAWIGLCAVEWKLDDPLQTIFAARMARKHMKDLLPGERDQLVLYQARALMALGQIEGENGAIELLRQEIVARGPGQCPELELYSASTMLDLARPELAKAILAHVIDRRDGHGERARVMQLRALALQKQWQQIVLFALESAELIGDPRRQAEAAEFLGDAYTRLGRHELAAEAYAGRIR